MKTILVIEDEKPIRAYVTKLLQAEGYTVLSAEDGVEGLSLARRHRPDLVLCDVVMPKLWGYGVLEALRTDPATASIPFLFLSARSEQDDIRHGIELGSDNYLTKPVVKAELLGAVAARLASLDQQNIPPEIAAKMDGVSRIGWFYFNVVKPQLEQRYLGWYVAIEPESGKCFLGRSQQEVFDEAHKVMPGRTFYCREIATG